LKKSTPLVLIIVFLLSGISYGQTNPKSPVTKQALFYHSQNDQSKLHPGLRNTGIVFTALGLATILGGAAMVNAADGVTSYSSQTYNGVTQTEGSFSGAMGALGIVGGSVSTAGGIVMLIFGNKKLQKQKRRATEVSLSFNSFRLIHHF
jgi:hypothetical protein